MKREHSFNVLLNQREHEQLMHQANEEGCSAGHIIRRALSIHFGMTAAGIPQCANGQTCFVPHMHNVPRADYHAKSLH